jgi:hypothetical protein
VLVWASAGRNAASIRVREESGGCIAFHSNDRRILCVVIDTKTPIRIAFNCDSEPEHFPQSDIDIGLTDELSIDANLEVIWKQGADAQ